MLLIILALAIGLLLLFPREARYFIAALAVWIFVVQPLMS